ncbi:uncharacterized protein LOC126603058 [Malus sylvestris]|uniref:uncharacterized protein LOC126603058 n=1 Tax=Malus sylvestris TaxID=3752 RepID=UPI0021AC6557|nr:uncharacterized protein LOC126603058 [Malus sylvestris]
MGDSHHLQSNHGDDDSQLSPSTPVAQALVEDRPIPAKEAVHARPASKVGKPVVVSLVEAPPVLEKAVPSAEKTSAKPVAVILEESEGSDEVPLVSHLRSHRQPPPVSKAAVQVGLTTADHGQSPAGEPATAADAPVHLQDQDLQSVFEAAVRVGISTVDHGKRPVGEPEASAETPVHPQHHDINVGRGRRRRPSSVLGVIRGRPLKKVEAAAATVAKKKSAVSKRAEASWEVEFKALLSSTTGGAGPSVAVTEAANSTAQTRLQEVLSLSAS